MFANGRHPEVDLQLYVKWRQRMSCREMNLAVNNCNLRWLIIVSNGFN